MTESNLAVRSPELPALADLPAERMRVVTEVLCPGASRSELELFWAFCQRTGLDPFAKQIYALKRKQKDENGQWSERLSIQTSIDGFRVIAERNPDYAGQVGPLWCGPDGAWKDVWLSPDPPRAAKVGVCRKGFAEPLFAVATWDEYAQTKSTGEPVAMWRKMPSVMLAKCAESQALRRAFPNDMSGVYTDAEMGQADADPPPRKRVESTTAAVAPPEETIGDERAEAIRHNCERRGITKEMLAAKFGEHPDNSIADWPASRRDEIKAFIESYVRPEARPATPTPVAAKPAAPKPTGPATAEAPEYWIGKLKAEAKKKFPAEKPDIMVDDLADKNPKASLDGTAYWKWLYETLRAGIIVWPRDDYLNSLEPEPSPSDEDAELPF